MSDPAQFRKRTDVGTGHHRVIEYPHVHQRQRGLQDLHRELIGTARLDGSRRV